VARLVVTPTTLEYELSGWEKVGACRGDLVVPRSEVLDVRAVPSVWSAVRGIRAPGYGMPGHRMLGTWRYKGGKDFVDARYGQAGVVVELSPHERFRRLVLTVPDPDATVRDLTPVR
jgi:hypothetical protein